MNSSLTHLALHVRDVDESVRFYRAFCGLKLVHQRDDHGKRVVWLAEPGMETRFVLVLIPGGKPRPRADRDFSHLGFAVQSREAVDAIAGRAREAGCLLWEPEEAPYPVGYYCAAVDPDGNAIEFSYGQPLGPGAPSHL